MLKGRSVRAARSMSLLCAQQWVRWPTTINRTIRYGTMPRLRMCAQRCQPQNMRMHMRSVLLAPMLKVQQAMQKSKVHAQLASVEAC